jgi:hypothetical protein
MMQTLFNALPGLIEEIFAAIREFRGQHQTHTAAAAALDARVSALESLSSGNKQETNAEAAAPAPEASHVG